MSLDEICEVVAGFSCTHVTVTGGEPLAQPACITLLSRLCDAGYEVSLETSGAMDIAGVDERVSVVLDLKTPGSNEAHRNHLENIPLLKSKDQVKFVICDRKDYDWSVAKLLEFNLGERVGEVLFSPSYEQQSARELGEWILQDHIPARLQLQLHKLLWGEEQGR